MDYKFEPIRIPDDINNWMKLHEIKMGHRQELQSPSHARTHSLRFVYTKMKHANKNTTTIDKTTKFILINTSRRTHAGNENRERRSGSRETVLEQ